MVVPRRSRKRWNTDEAGLLFTLALISKSFLSLIPSMSMKIGMNLIQNTTKCEMPIHSENIYFSRPLSASRRCVSVMDIFSQLVVVTGLSSVGFSIRNWDIRWTSALADGLAAVSVIVDDAGTGGDWIGCGGGATRRRIRSHSSKVRCDENEAGTFSRWYDNGFLFYLIHRSLQFIQRFSIGGIERFLSIVNVQFAANNDAEPATRRNSYRRWEWSRSIAFDLLWFVIGLKEKWDDALFPLMCVFTFYDEEAEGIQVKRKKQREKVLQRRHHNPNHTKQSLPNRQLGESLYFSVKHMRKIDDASMAFDMASSRFPCIFSRSTVRRTRLLVFSVKPASSLLQTW